MPGPALIIWQTEIYAATANLAAPFRISGSTRQIMSQDGDLAAQTTDPREGRPQNPLNICFSMTCFFRRRGQRELPRSSTLDLIGPGGAQPSRSRSTEDTGSQPAEIKDDALIRLRSFSPASNGT